MARLPTLYVSHGSPNLAITPDTPAYRFLSRAASQLPRPEAILVVSAHYCTQRPAYATALKPTMIYDFGGFDPRLYQFDYRAPGAPAVSRRAAGLLAEAGLEADEDTGRGYDHGVWVPLHIMYPEADIPVAQVSMQPLEDSRHHFRLGRALKPLRDEGVLIIASGSFTHNLSAIERDGLYNPPHPRVTRFVDWMHDRLVDGDREQLLDAIDVAPHAVDNHPYDDHLLPLFVAMGAADDDEPVSRLHTSYEYGVLSMDAYRFGAAA
ncbi:MAG: dioxygenase [Hyphomicrobiaceae bacterium]